MTMGKEVSLLSDLVINHIIKKGNLLFPDGIYGDCAYFLDKEGFLGPLHIPTYIVPANFSKTTKRKFMERLHVAGLSLDSERDQLMEQADGLDLSYGEGWDLEVEASVPERRIACHVMGDWGVNCSGTISHW